VDLLIYIQAYVPLSEKTHILTNFSLKNMFKKIFYQTLPRGARHARQSIISLATWITSRLNQHPDGA
jgi:hypothetical protein